MNTYRFSGSPAFLASAAARLGLSGTSAEVRGEAALAAVANLCAQAAEADAPVVAEILAKADQIRDRIKVALLAADLMIDGVREGRGLGPTAPSRRPSATNSGPNAGGRGSSPSHVPARSKKS